MDLDDSDSDGLEFYESTGRELDEFLSTTDDIQSVRSCGLTGSSTFTSKDDEELSSINNALALNKQCEDKYRKLEEVLYKSLQEIRQRLKENTKEINLFSKASNENRFCFLRSGKPYFKDHNNYPAPDNEDTIAMREANMYDFSNVSSVPGWTVKDKTQLVNTLQEISRDIRHSQYKSEIDSLLQQDPVDDTKIAELEKKISELKKKTLAEVALPIDYEYDWEDIANKLNRRHTAHEYKALWKLYFHPSINKNNWSKVEHHRLQKIAAKHNMQDWDAIAEELDMGKTGYQCFVYYRTNMMDSYANRKWTAEEVEYLQRVIDYYREGTYIPWGKVATAMDNRTKIQVYNKYTRMMERRKGRFLEEEDMVILHCYDKYGVNFKKISEYLPGRSAVQLRNRFKLLTKFRMSTTWSVEDDKKLLKIMANQDTNSSFSTAVKHFPGKDRMHIRSRYQTLVRWMKQHPTTDIQFAPRRGARRLIHGNPSLSLSEALSNLNARMEKEVKIRKKKRLDLESQEEDIQDAIMTFILNERLVDEAQKAFETELNNLANLQFHQEGSPHSININNFKNLLILLDTGLKQEYVVKAKCNKKLSRQGKPDQSLLTVKSYSKTKTIRTIKFQAVNKNWGYKKLGYTPYVLPPNFSTITGCRVLMNQINRRMELNIGSEVNLFLLTRRNENLRKNLSKLKERMTTVFLWPLFLSNEFPNVPDREPYVFKQPHNETRKLLPEAPGVTIPVLNKCQRLRETLNKSVDIDLPKEQDNTECNLMNKIENPVDEIGSLIK